jgi:site-specific DNA-methyltransferase (adenine-specific)
MPKSDVFNMDCNLGMKKYEDNFFDIAVVDPPYFSGPEKREYYGSNVSVTKVKRNNYGVTTEWTVPDTSYFEELIRVSKHQIIWGCNYYEYLLGPGRIIWDKVNGESSFSDCEIAYTSFHDSVRKFTFMWNGMMQGKSALEGHIQQGNKKLNEKRIHPTQKPVMLYDWIFATYAQAGQKILDTHLGSGSSRISAFKYDLDFVGFELDQEHFKRQEKRFKEYSAQGVLF